jgi:NAD(P)-dependent dehydrogenase (short-subunit alcohol dehydrogenase family)
MENGDARHNAASLSKPFAETTQEDFENVYKVNVLQLLI